MEIEGMHEADITINGQALTFAQSMTLRVAVTSLHLSMANRDVAHALGPISQAYAERCRELEALITAPPVAGMRGRERRP